MRPKKQLWSWRRRSRRIPVRSPNLSDSLSHAMFWEPKNTSSIFSSFATARTVKEPASRAHRQGLFIMTQISSSPMVHILTCRCLTTKSSRQQPCSLCRPYSSDLMWLMMMMMMMMEMMMMMMMIMMLMMTMIWFWMMILNDDDEWWWWWWRRWWWWWLIWCIHAFLRIRIYDRICLACQVPMAQPHCFCRQGDTSRSALCQWPLPPIQRGLTQWKQPLIGRLNSFKELRFILVNSILKRGLQNGSGH